LPRVADILAFSADGRQLAAGLNEGEILLFNTTTGHQEVSLDAHRAGKLRAFYFLVFCPDGRTLLSMGLDSESHDSICQWDIATQTLRRRVVPAYRGFRSTVALSPDGRLLAVPAGRGPVNLFDTQTGQVCGTLQGDGNRAEYGLAFSPDGKTLAT